MSINYYEILEIKSESSKDEIKKAYRRLSLKWHPDRNLGNEEEAAGKFKEINEAYENLMLGKSENISRIAIFAKLEELSRELEQELDEIESTLDSCYWMSTNSEVKMLKEKAVQLIKRRFVFWGFLPILPPLTSEVIPEFNFLGFNYLDWETFIRNSGKASKLKENFKMMNNAIDTVAREITKNNTPPSSPPLKSKQIALGKNENQEPKRGSNQQSPLPNENNQENNDDPNSKIPSPNNDKQQGNQEKNNQNSDNSQQNNHSNKDKDEKISQLETEIEQLKSQNSGVQTSEQRAENQKRIEEKEKELEKTVKGDSQNDNEDYKNLTHEELVKEIKKLKAEIEELKASNSPNNLEKQLRLQAKLEKLEKIKANFSEKSNNSDNKFPTGWVIWSMVLLVVGGLMITLIIKKYKK